MTRTILYLENKISWQVHKSVTWIKCAEVWDIYYMEYICYFKSSAVRAAKNNIFAFFSNRLYINMHFLFQNFCHEPSRQLCPVLSR